MTEPKDKPVLSEQAFEKLLEAGYVLQEHARKIRELEARREAHSERLREQEAANEAPLPKRKPKSEETSRANIDYTLTLAEIVEAQRQIQTRHLEMDKAMAVIAEKVAHIAGATGAGIGILDGKIVRYRAGAGSPALPVGTEVPLATAVCAASIRTGQVIRSDDVNTEVLFDPEPCRERGILSLVAVPIYHDGDIVGALELYFDRTRGYAEQDIHTCQLMAGLVTEAIGRDSDSKVKKSMAAERSTMLAAIEKLRPDLTARAENQAAAAKMNARTNAATAAKLPCWKCGSSLLAEEQFCGKCGAPRDSDSEPASMQSKLASAWHMQQASQETVNAPPANGASHPGNGENALPVAGPPFEHEPDVKADQARRGLFNFSLPTAEETDAELEGSFSSSAHEDAMAVSLSAVSASDEDGAEVATALAKPQDEDVTWSSAAKARDFLESVSANQTPSRWAALWHTHRGDFYLAVAVILVVVVIRWGIWSSRSLAATGHGNAVSGNTNRKQPAPDAELSTFDKLLVSLGLAEAPAPPEYKGNPDTQVWIDLQTALYHCPGSDLYNKTPKGRLSSQREAQLDQFEPANRKPCE